MTATDPRSLPSAVVLEDVLRQGREALAAGEIEGALRTFDAALRIKPTYAPAWRGKARAHRLAGDPQGALDCYAEALRYEPDDSSSWFGLALSLHDLGRGEEEIHAYDELIRRNPRHVAAWMNRGVAFHEQGKFEDALACYDRILAMRPEFAPAWNDRGAALLRLNRLEEALVAFDEALALDPTLVDAAENRRAVLDRLGRKAPPPSRATFPEAGLAPNLQPRLLANLGLPAVAAWHRVRAEVPEDWITLGTALLDEDHPDGAASAFAKADAMGGGAAGAFGRLMAFEIRADPGVLEVAARTLAAFPDVPRIAASVASIREKAGDLAGAVAALDTVLRRDAALPWLWTWKGLLLLRMDRSTEAREAFGRAVAVDPADAETLASLAAALYREGRPGEALAACDRALTLDPECAAAWNNKGVILAARGRAKEADRALRSAAKADATLVAFLNQARFAESRRQYRTALEFYTRACERAPTDGEALAGRRRALGLVGARERKARARFVERLKEVPGIGPATAARIADVFDTAAKLRRVTERELQTAASLTKDQARAVKRAFIAASRTGSRRGRKS